MATWTVDMNSKFASRRPNTERLEIKIPPEQKRRAFEVAAREGVSVGHLIRSALNATIGNPKHLQGERNG